MTELLEKDLLLPKNTLSLLVRVAEQRVGVLSEQFTLVVNYQLVLEALNYSVKLLFV